MFTVLFAAARSVGWITQWSEMMSEKLQKIGRPRQLYVGEPARNFVKIEEREEVEKSRVIKVPKLVDITGLTFL